MTMLTPPVVVERLAYESSALLARKRAIAGHCVFVLALL